MIDLDEIARALAGDFEVLDKIGEGGMGVVLKARQRSLRRVVALKIATFLDDEARLRFRSEAKVLSRLNHPSIVKVYDATLEGETPYFVMEYVEGLSLGRQIDGRAMRPDRVLEIARAVAGGLSHAHALGLVHRDIKPDNILLTRDGEIKIADFGLAKWVSTGDGAPTAIPRSTFQGNLEAEAVSITRDGFFVGSPHYSSPEQIRGDPIGPFTDVYSLGVTLHEALTGTNPFAGGDVVEVLTRHLKIRPPAPSSVNAAVPPGLDALLMRMLEKRPDLRPCDGAALVAELEGIPLGRTDGPAARVVEPTRAVRPPSAAEASPDLAPLPGPASRRELGRVTSRAALAPTRAATPAARRWFEPNAWTVSSALAVWAVGLWLWLGQPAPVSPPATPCPVARSAAAIPPSPTPPSSPEQKELGQLLRLLKHPLKIEIRGTRDGRLFSRRRPGGLDTSATAALAMDCATLIGRNAADASAMNSCLAHRDFVFDSPFLNSRYVTPLVFECVLPPPHEKGCKIHVFTSLVTSGVQARLRVNGGRPRDLRLAPVRDGVEGALEVEPPALVPGRNLFALEIPGVSSTPTESTIDFILTPQGDPPPLVVSPDCGRPDGPARALWDDAGRAFHESRYLEAVELAEKVLATRPGFVSAHGCKAESLHRSGQYARALLAFQEALRIAPGRMWTWHDLGVTLKDWGRRDEARRALTQALRLSPREHWNWRDLAYVEAACDRPKQAIEYLELAVAVLEHPHEHQSDVNRVRCDIEALRRKLGRR